MSERYTERGVFLRFLMKLEENGAPEEIRTPDPQIRSLVLYPAELRVRAGSGQTACVGGSLKGPLRDCNSLSEKIATLIVQS